MLVAVIAKLLCRLVMVAMLDGLVRHAGLGLFAVPMAQRHRCRRHGQRKKHEQGEQARNHEGAYSILYVKTEQHDVAILNHIFLALSTHLARLLRARFTVIGDIILISYCFGANEPAFKIGVDDARRLRGF